MLRRSVKDSSDLESLDMVECFWYRVSNTFSGVARRLHRLEVSKQDFGHLILMIRLQDTGTGSPDYSPVVQQSGLVQSLHCGIDSPQQ